MQAQNTIKMIASFNRGVFVPLVGQMSGAVNVHNFLKEKGARISLDHVKAMLEGKERAFKDFEVVEILGHQGDIPAQASAPARLRPLPGTLVSGPQSTAMKSDAAAVPKGRGREYAPTGEVKPLKRGTVYAQLMEMLLHGATMKELLAATTNATAGGVNDVLSWQIKQRGYGLRFDQETGKYWLVLPKGHTGLTYQA